MYSLSIALQYNLFTILKFADTSLTLVLLCFYLPYLSVTVIRLALLKANFSALARRESLNLLQLTSNTRRVARQISRSLYAL